MKIKGRKVKGRLKKKKGLLRDIPSEAAQEFAALIKKNITDKKNDLLDTRDIQSNDNQGSNGSM